MKKIICRVSFFVCFLLLCNLVVLFANEYEGYSRLEKQLLQMQEKLNELEQSSNKNNKENDMPSILQDLVIGGGITFVLQGASNSNIVNKKKYNGTNPTVGSYSVDLGFTKSFGKHDKVFLHLETGQGSLDEQIQIFSGVNFDGDIANAVITVTEAWYEHYFGNSGFGFTFGKLDASTGVDENNFANDETTQFLGCLFRNSATIDIPFDNSFGATLFYETSIIDLTFQAVSANANFEDITRNVFSSFQATIKPSLIGTLEGNYRIYTWINTIPHKKWDDNTNKDENSYGFGLSFDQELSKVFGVFARYGWKNQNVYYELDEHDEEYSLSSSWSIGVQANVKVLSSNDIVAIAYGQVIPSNDYKVARNKIGKNENHLEIYYNWQATDFLSITPDFQIIENPFGCDIQNGEDTVYVGGIRAQIDF